MATAKQAADFLKNARDVYILSHVYPDGDTLGSAFALCRMLQKMGKRAKVLCEHTPSPRYAFLQEGILEEDFSPETVVCVDVADESLLGSRLQSRFGGKIHLCIDHHASNVEYAGLNWIDSRAAATAEMIWELLPLLEVQGDPQIAACIFTGITTDTGCFRYSSATPRTYRIAADLMEQGAKAGEINRAMFDTKTRSLMEIERRATDSMEFFYEDRCAVMAVTLEMIRLSGAGEDDLEGLPAIPRQVEGVLAGVTLREKKPGEFKISVRAQAPLNAAELCAIYGGGGHDTAGGCSLSGSLQQVREKMLEAVGRHFREKGIL